VDNTEAKHWAKLKLLSKLSRPMVSGKGTFDMLSYGIKGSYLIHESQ